MATEVKFGDWIGKGFELYKQNLGTLVLASLVAMLLSTVSVGILAGPMLAGLTLIALHIVDRKEGKPEIGMVFQGFSYFLPTLLFALVWGAIIVGGSFLLGLVICIGNLAAMVGTYVLGTLLMFGIFLIVDRRMDFWPASMESLQTVKAQFLPLLGLYVVAGLIGSVGALLCGIGLILTLPITVMVLAVAYREFYPAEGEASGESAAPASPTQA